MKMNDICFRRKLCSDEINLGRATVKMTAAAASCSQSNDWHLDTSMEGGEFSPEKKELIVGRSVKTVVQKQINRGSFGQIHLGRLQNSGQEVVVKMEPQNAKNPQLLFEGNVYRHLEGGPGIPKTFWFGIHEPDYIVLVMELLGPSLQDLFMYCGRKFSVKTTLLLADQIIDILAFFHRHHFIHRDIKPDNFMMGRGENRHKVFIIDFGLAKKYSGHRVLGHHHYHLAHHLVGTARYASLHSHLGHEENPRNDLESLAYMLIYFLKGSLPWQSLMARNKEDKFTKIKDLKMKTPLDVLCQGLPEEFGIFLQYARRLSANDRPDYKHIKEHFRNYAQKHEILYDDRFDWVIQEEQTGEPVVIRDHMEDKHLSS